MSYKLFEDVDEKDFKWVWCRDAEELKQVVEFYKKKGYASCINDGAYTGTPNLIIIENPKAILHSGASMSYTLRHNGVPYIRAKELLESQTKDVH